MANKAKEKEIFPFSNWTVEVHRRAFRRSVSIYLYPKKPIKVVAGNLTSTKLIYEFLLSKKPWIEKNFSKFEELAAKFPEKKIRSYEVFPFFGRSLRLRMAITVLKKPFVAVQDEELRLHIPRNDWSAEVLTDEHPRLLAEIRDFYKREAVKKITERTEHWAQQMKLYPATLRFREQRTRWGSCSSRGAINFNWRLIVFKPEIIDYVIVHELAHLKHMNHSANFWSLVQAHVPGYELLMKELRESQHLCEFLTPRY
jgi:predicted metal-dependent hydrolase